MASLQWFFVIALAIVAFSEARPHIRKRRYKLKGRTVEEQTDVWTYIDDDDSYCGNINMTTKEKDTLHQRRKLERALPFTAYLVKKHRHNYQPVCVATILPDADDESSSIVLTLTTCIETGAQLEHYKVYTGRKLPVALNKTTKLYDIEEVAVDKKSPNLKFANAMVIKLNSSIPFNKNRQPICLPRPDTELRENSKCILTVVRTDGKPKPYLIDVQSKSNAYCKRMLNEHVMIDTRMEICGLDYRDGSFISRGGSLVCEGDNGKWIQYGIYTHASHIIDRVADKESTSRLQTKARPSVYVNVAPFRKLMQDAQNLQTLSRINLMKLR